MSADEEGTGGLWDELGVPHRGWSCVDIIDLEELGQTCQMCKRRRIRYVHVMSHPNFEDELECGCVCAGKMEEDYVAAQDRERRMKNRASRRERFPQLVKWKVSAKGNLTIVFEGYRITVFLSARGWKASINQGYNRETIFLRRLYQNPTDAKKGAFDRVMALKDGVGTPARSRVG